MVVLECVGWIDILDNLVVCAARANIYDFAFIIFKNVLRGRFEVYVGDVMFVLLYFEFVRLISFEYV